MCVYSLEISILEKAASFALNYRVPFIQPRKAANVAHWPIAVNTAATANFGDQIGYLADRSAFEL